MNKGKVILMTCATEYLPLLSISAHYLAIPTPTDTNYQVLPSNTYHPAKCYLATLIILPSVT